jgi:hypothetical protein
VKAWTIRSNEKIRVRACGREATRDQHRYVYTTSSLVLCTLFDDTKKSVRTEVA